MIFEGGYLNKEKCYKQNLLVISGTFSEEQKFKLLSFFLSLDINDYLCEGTRRRVD